MTRWKSDTAYLFGIDLFNAGYYWEAHDAWESCWRAAKGRDSVKARLTKTLILIAAGWLKRKMGRGRGARLLFARAQGQLEEILVTGSHVMGLDLTELQMRLPRGMEPAPKPLLAPRSVRDPN